MSKKNTARLFSLLTFLVLALGIIFRFLMMRRFLWTDENYSIYFAAKYTFSQLFFLFSGDSHPGAFYALVKLLLHFTQNLQVVRLFTSFVPQVVGIFFLSYVVNLVYPARQEKKLLILILVSFLSLNPFFIDLSFQIRVYSLVFFFTCLNLSWLLLWEKTHQSKYLKFLFLGLVLGNSLSHSMFLFSLATLCYLILPLKKTLQRKIMMGSIGLIFLVVQFLLQNSFNFKLKAENASWIPLPTLTNTAELFLTLLGFFHNTTQDLVQWGRQHLLFYLTFTIIFLLFIKGKLKFTSESFSKFHAFVAFPFSLCFFISIFFFIFSQRFFFHLFLPQLSLWLPRFFVPFLIVFFLVCAEAMARYFYIFKKQILKIALVFVMSIFLLFWLQKDVAALSLYRSAERTSILSRMLEASLSDEQKKLNVMAWPYWIWIETITPQSISKVKLEHIETKINLSKKFSDLVKTELIQSCKTVANVRFYFAPVVVEHLAQDRDRVKFVLEQCCTKVATQEQIEEWLCQNSGE